MICAYLIVIVENDRVVGKGKVELDDNETNRMHSTDQIYLAKKAEIDGVTVVGRLLV